MARTKTAIINHRFALPTGALVASVAVKETARPNLNDDFTLQSFQAMGIYRDFTAGQGPIWIGICNSDLSVTEVGEYLTAGGPLDRTNRVLQEQVTRPVMLLGQTNVDAAGNIIWKSGGGDSGLFQKFHMYCDDAHGMELFAFNDDDNDLTTGGQFAGFIRYKGVWS